MSSHVYMNGKKLRADRELARLTLEEAADLLQLEPHVLAGLEEERRTLTVKRAEELNTLAKSEYQRRIIQNAQKARRAEDGIVDAPRASRPPIPTPKINFRDREEG